jgi:hypothetical protein
MTVTEKAHQQALGVTMDQSVPIEVLPNDRLADVINARVRKPGGLYKRYGYSAYPRTKLLDGANVTAGKRFIRRENELCFTDGNYLYSWVEGLSKWVIRDRAPECQVLDRQPQVSDQSNGAILVTSVAHGVGQTCVIIQRSTASGFDLWGRVFRGDTLINETLLASSITGLSDVITCGLFFVVIWDDGTNDFVARRWDILDSTNPAWGSPVTLRSDQDSSGFWAVAEIPALAEFAVAYRRNGGGNQLDVYRFDQALSSTDSAVNQRAGKVFDLIGMRVIGTTLTIAIRNTTDGVVEAFGLVASTLNVDFAPVTVFASITNISAPLLVGERTSLSAWVLAALEGTSAPPFVDQPGIRYRGVGVPSGTPDAVVYDTYNVRPLSHIFNYADHSYMAVTPTNGDLDRTQRAAAVVDLGAAEVLAGDEEYRARPLARWAEGELYSVLDVAVSRAPAGSTLGTFLISTINTPRDEDRGILADVVTLNFDDIAAPRWVGQSQIGGDTLIPGGMLHAYDGELCFEAGWTYYPHIRGAETFIQAPGLATATYEYVVCYVKRDKQGRLWRSRPSLPITAGVDGDPDNAIRLRITHYSVTSMHDSAQAFAHPVAVEVYRRTGSAPFVRLATIASSDPTALPYLAYVDDGSALTTNQPELYTTGGVLENHTSRPCRYSQMFDNRLFLAGCDDDEVVHFSREIVGSEGAFFNIDQEFRIDDGQGIKALANQDSSLLMLKDDNDGIFYIQGSGPNDFGLESSYTDPRKIANAHGCIEPRSVLTTAMGTFFQSRHGIEVIGRGEGVQLVGDKIEDTLALHPTITSCIYEPASGEVRWTMVAENNGQVGVFTEPTKTWARDIWFGGSGKRTVDAAMVGGVYHWLGPNGVVYRETIGAYRDISPTETLDLAVSSVFTTGDISLAGPLGKVSHFRVGLLGRAVGEHDLGIAVALDQGQTAAGTKTFTTAEVNAFKWFPIEVPVVNLTVQQGRSIRIVVTDTPTDPEISSGTIWFYLLVEYGTEREFQPLPVPPVNRK